MIKKIYIAGKMTGLPFYNYDAFYRAEKKLLKAYPKKTIINPAKIGYMVVKSKDDSLCADGYFVGDVSAFVDDIITAERDALSTCDCIYLLKGWETSKGTRTELKYALEHNFEILSEK